MSHSSDEPLFRKEVVHAQSQRLHGDVILQQTLPTKILTGIIVLIVLATACWVTMARYARTETARGMLMPVGGYAKIYAPRAGIVFQLGVKDGDIVRAGQKLAVIRIENPNEAGTVGSQEELASIGHQANFALTQIKLAGQRSVGETARLAGVINGLNNQIRMIRDQMDLQEQVVSSMTTTFAQAAPVVERGYISKIDYERRRQALLTAQEDLSRLRQQAAATESDIARTERERSQSVLSGRTDEASARSALETLHQQRTKVSSEASYLIEAPVSGRVTSVQTGVGRSAESLIPLMVLVPDNLQLRADLFVPSKAIGFVKAGQEVRLLYDAYPYQRFGTFVAHVETISRIAIAGQETGAPFKIDEPVYRVTVKLDSQSILAYGEHIALQPGMTLVGNFILERQSFLAWMLDPLHAVSNRN